MKRLLQLIILGALAYSGWTYRHPIEALFMEFKARHEASGKKNQHLPDPEQYEILKADLERKRQSLARGYAQARSANEMFKIRTEARETLESALPKLMRCWLGTAWDFSGTSQIPGEGRIACGYYVSTVMRDAGFDLERIRLAQQPSQNIIETFIQPPKMHVRVGISYDKFLKEVTARGPGIRIVGLDRHVAFLVVEDDGDVRFIHSSGGVAKSVVDQSRDEATTLQKSRYRVTGNITGNDQVINDWLMRRFWKTKQ